MFTLLMTFACLANPAPSDLPALLDAVRLKHEVPALGVLVARNGRIDRLVTLGTVSINSNEPVRPDDLWHLGSNTKALTATLAARMVEKKQLSWTTTLNDVAPELAKELGEGWASVSLIEWLSHRSGTDGENEPLAWLGSMRQLEADASTTPQHRRQQALRIALGTPGPTGPTGFTYTNVNYLAAGVILEAAGNASWEALLDREIFEPLGIVDFAFGPPPRILGTLEGKAIRLDNPLTLGPAGTLCLTLEDWLKFANAHLGLYEGFLTEQSLATLHTAPDDADPYALGWAAVSLAGEPVLTHDGSNTLNYARIVIAPQSKRVVLIVMNRAEPDCADDVLRVLME
jgi:CubicO group peptidase (beta-lactamase class C family)